MSRRPLLIAVLLLVVGGSATAGAVDTGVLAADLADPTAATTADGVQYAWADEPAVLSVQVGAPAFEGARDYRHYAVHATESRVAQLGPTQEPLGTARLVLEPLGTERVRLELDAKALSEPGPQTIHVGLYAANGTRIDDEALTVTVIRKTGDADGDGLRNAREIDGETDFLDPDTDNDGLRDGPEVTEFGTDPTRPDSDGDNLSDPVEVREGTDPWAADTDGDGLTDERELELGTDPTRADTDRDGLADDRELDLGTDPAVMDTDGDGLGDGRELELGTDPTRADTDGDGHDDGWELERFGTDPTAPNETESGTTGGQDGSRTTGETSESLQATVEGLGSALAGGLLPVAGIASGLAARRVFEWATYR